MSTEVIVQSLPNCDLCSSQGTKKVAHYDAATQMGPWAYMCEYHFRHYGVGLGTGAGQRLILAEGK